MTVLLTLMTGLTLTAHAGSEARFAKKYGKVLGCDAVTAEEIPGSRDVAGAIRHYRFTGCGQTFHMAIRQKMWSTRYDDLALARRAPLDMDCEAVEIAWLDPKTRSVSGCNRRVTYVYTGTLRPLFVEGSWVADAANVGGSQQP